MQNKSRFNRQYCIPDFNTMTLTTTWTSSVGFAALMVSRLPEARGHEALRRTQSNGYYMKLVAPVVY